MSAQGIALGNGDTRPLVAPKGQQLSAQGIALGMQRSGKPVALKGQKTNPTTHTARRNQCCITAKTANTPPDTSASCDVLPDSLYT